MQGKAISKIIILGTIALIGMLLVQGIWLAKSLDSRKSQFTQNVQSALRASTNAIIKYNGANTSMQQPIEQLSSNYFVVPINDTLQPSLLKSVLLSEFKLRNIDQAFEFSIYDCSSENIVFGSYISQKDEASINAEFPEILKDDYYFSVLFPNISFQLINEMSLWLSSSFILLLIVSVFAYTVFALFRQKRLADFQRDFINNMTHEFKTPLAAIGASSEMMMANNMQAGRRKQHVNIINKEATRLTKQVEQFLQLSKMEEFSPELKSESVNLSQLIVQCANHFDWALKEKGGKIEVNLPEQEIWLNTDKTHLANCLHNIIDNAIKYGGKPPLVRINLEQLNQEQLITVSDNGSGISKNDQNLIFDRFYRISTGDVHDVKGFGLGLYYVKMMSELLNGEVYLSHSDEKGTKMALKIKNDA